jgi:hypothetical protein
MAPKRLRHDSPLVTGDGIQPAAPTTSPLLRAPTQLNSDFPWDEFDSDWYYNHNYKTLRDDDRQIIQTVRDFFVTLDPSNHRHGIDVGSGSNLYPALAMLPLCREITLYEYSASNIVWLQREIQSYSPSWDSFWQSLAIAPLYKAIDSPRTTLAAVARVERGNVFDLSRSQWDIGTMFFTAESISSTPAEFRAALRSFITSLRAGAPFAAAFMEKSVGYDVGPRRFPAVAVTVSDVENFLAANVEDFNIYRIGLTNKPLRDGYGGMILATGRAAAA